MGAIERDIARHAEEVGRQELLEEQVEATWKEAREDFIETLATGGTLRAFSKVVLDKTDLVDWLFSDYPDESNEAVVLCLTDPVKGKAALQGLARKVATRLVDAFEDRFKQEIQSDIEKGEAA